MNKFIVFWGLTMALFSDPAMAVTVLIEASRDNTLYESPSGRLSNGAGEHMFAGLTADLLKRRAVIAFKDLSDIPTGAKISSVKLHLNLSQENSDSSAINLYRLVSDWGEGRSDAVENEGQGANSELNDATWVHTSWPDFTWRDAGGDFVESPSDQQSVDAMGAYVFGSTQGLVDDVQEWLDNPLRNFGWILVGDETVKSAKRFDTRENTIPANRPLLEVEYSTTGTSSDFSGLWYDLSLDGEGYNVYQTPRGWLIYFFGYSDDGRFLWLTSDLVRLDDLVLDVPFELPMLIGNPGSFDKPTPGNELTPYGTLSVTFYKCTAGLFILDGLDGKKTSNVVKLLGVDGTVCSE